MAIIKTNARSASALDATILTRNLPAISGASLTNIDAGTHVKISSQTASNSSYINFTSGIDSTYNQYIFKFHGIHAANDGTNFHYNADDNAGSGGYAIAGYSAFVQMYNNTSDAGTSIGGESDSDRAGSTDCLLSRYTGNENDESINGELRIYNPSSTSFFKQYEATMANYYTSNGACVHFIGGYWNTTSAINAFRFGMVSGNMESGTITLYGVKT